MTMKTSSVGIDLIRSFEGLRLHSYQDPVGIWTIGYGSIRVNHQPVTQGMVITESQALDYLAEELEYFENRVNQMVTVPLNQNQFDALVSFTFNLGEGNLGKSTLLKKLNTGDYQGASAEFVKWNKAGGKVLAGLTRRRTAERDLFLS